MSRLDNILNIMALAGTKKERTCWTKEELEDDPVALYWTEEELATRVKKELCKALLDYIEDYFSDQLRNYSEKMAKERIYTLFGESISEPIKAFFEQGDK